MSEKSENLYITTTLPYVNAEPHVGHALEFVRADVIARFQKLNGADVFFNTGTDEHGQKVFNKAIEVKREPQDYVDEYSEKFREVIKALGVSDEVHFIRTTNPDHKKAAQEFWKRCAAAGDIYKKNYKVKYCVGCELEKQESELENNRCPFHPNLQLELINEENYFFKFSKYQDRLLRLYSSNKDFVVPNTRKNEIETFVSRGLEDFSVSRLKEKMPWGVPVPEDEEHVMYVWFDALVNYISTLGWPKEDGDFDKYWNNGRKIQYAGKDNLRQQSAMWQAMLMSAEVKNSDNIVINGFITSGGKKMSKSTGNVIDPMKVIDEYGTDAVRYFVTREISTFEDGDWTEERFKEAYNANLANGIGNLASRIMKMAERNIENKPKLDGIKLPPEYAEFLNKFEIQKATDLIWQKISELDQKIQETEPFKLIKADKGRAVEIIKELTNELYLIATMLLPILPETSLKIKESIISNKSFDKPLFPRKD